jgi:hypothetical protein
VSPELTVLLGLFVLYTGAVTVLMRHALAARGPEARLRAARVLLITVSLGAPLLAGLILVA